MLIILILGLCVLISFIFIWICSPKTFMVESMRNDNLFHNPVDTVKDIHIVVINLRRSIDRRKRIQDIADKLNIKINFIEAVDGKKIREVKQIGDTKYYEVPYANKIIKIVCYDCILSPSEIACTISHINAIMSCSDVKYAMILEDDIDLSYIDTFGVTIKKLINSAPKDWEYLNICAHGNKKSTWNKYNSSFYGSQGYIINKKAIKSLRAIIINDVYTIDNNITDDAEYRNILNRKHIGVSDVYIPIILKSYVYVDTLLQVNNDTDKYNSSIHTEHTNSHIKLTEQYKLETSVRLNKKRDMLINRRDLITVLSAGIKGFNTIGLTYCIYHGTLLGVIRDNDIIEGDCDADCFILDNDVNKLLSLKSYFHYRGFTLESHFKGIKHTISGVPIGEQFARLVDKKTNKHLDIGILIRHNNLLCDPSPYINLTLRQTYEVDTIFPLKQINIFGIDINIPNKYNLVNTAMYNYDCYNVVKTSKQSINDENNSNIYINYLINKYNISLGMTDTYPITPSDMYIAPV